MAASLREDRLELVLPISLSAEGVWEQKASYVQPDLHDELVLDLEGPFATVASADTSVIRFVVTGDRNAGKSTLLHAFVNAHDQDWLRLTSLLPVLTGSFTNARFGGPPSGPFAVDPKKESCPPRDELPYLDTDVARTTLVFTREDFLFFCAEFRVSVDAQTCDYSAIEFVELGGDHLDAMRTATSTSNLHKAALAKSTHIVKNVGRFAYFLNCQALLSPMTLAPGRRQEENQGGKSIDIEGWRGLVSRLDWLRRTSLTFQSITVFASRLPTEDDDDAAHLVNDLERRAYDYEAPDDDVNDDVIGMEEEEDDDDPERSAVLEAVRRDDRGTPFTRALFRLLKKHHPELGVVAVRPARHVRPGHGVRSKVDVPGLASVLVALFRNDLASFRAANVDTAVAAALFECCACAAKTVYGEDHSHFFAPFVTAETFRTWLEEEQEEGGESCCGRHKPFGLGVLPAHLALARFGPGARALVDRGLLVGRVDRGQAAVSVQVVDEEAKKSIFLLTPAHLPPDEDPSETPTDTIVYAQRGDSSSGERRKKEESFAVRAPLFPALLRLVGRCFDNDLLQDDGNLVQFPSALGPDLDRVAKSLDAALVDASRRFRPTHDATKRRILWLAEDRTIVQRLQAAITDQDHPLPNDLRLTRSLPRDPALLKIFRDYHQHHSLELCPRTEVLLSIPLAPP